MQYVSIAAADASEVCFADADPQFLSIARVIDRRIRACAYSTDDHGIAPSYVPAVFQDVTSGGYLAGYLVTRPLQTQAAKDAPSVIDSDVLYTDPLSAAMAADRFADEAAEWARVYAPELTRDEVELIRMRGRAPDLMGRNDRVAFKKLWRRVLASRALRNLEALEENKARVRQLWAEGRERAPLPLAA